MPHLSEKELVHHFQDMAPGSLDGAREVAPWQDEYTIGGSHDENEVVAELASRLASVVAPVDGIRTSDSAPRNDKLKDPLSPLRAIADLGSELEQVYERHETALHKLRCQAFLANAPTAPIARLPDEVLALIFEFAASPLFIGPYPELYHWVDGDTEFDDDYCPNPEIPAQRDVSAVCSRWRHVAHQTPSLWSNIIVHDRANFDTVRAWLSYGRSCPLDIKVAADQCTELARAKRVEFINRVSDRLRSLKVFGHHTSIQQLCEGWKERAPVLETLELTVMDYCDCKGEELLAVGPIPLMDPSVLPNLRSLTIRSPTFPFTMGTIFPDSPFLSLRSLSLDCNRIDPQYTDDEYMIVPDTPHTPDIAVMLRLLGCARNIEELHIYSTTFCDKSHDVCPTAISFEAVQLPTLHELEIKSSCRYGYLKKDCYEWLALLDAPNLKKVNINDSQHWQGEMKLACYHGEDKPQAVLQV